MPERRRNCYERRPGPRRAGGPRKTYAIPPTPPVMRMIRSQAVREMDGDLGHSVLSRLSISIRDHKASPANATQTTRTTSGPSAHPAIEGPPFAHDATQGE